MARSLADAQISFGLVNIPVKLYAASEAHAAISFNMLHTACGTRVEQQLWCPTCAMKLERTDTVKGYEFERGKYVRFTAEELESIEEESSKQIEIDQLLPAGTIDPVYLDRPYYLGTDKAGEKAYNLMAEALLQSMRVGIGKYHARGRDYLVVVRPRGPGSRDGLVMQELLYADEVRDFSEVPITVAAVSEREIGLALQIIEAVVAVCVPRGVPVTLKMRTGWAQNHKNAVRIARAAESAGVQMIAVHGRTRDQGYKGLAEYDTMAEVKAALKIPLVANGDIGSPEKARDVLAYTGADAVMIGRAAQGRPWIFRELTHFLATGSHLAPPLVLDVKRLLLDHLLDHYQLYGEFTGVRTARKHIGWYVNALPGGDEFRGRMNALEDCRAQLAAVADFFDALGADTDSIPAAADSLREAVDHATLQNDKKTEQAAP